MQQTTIENQVTFHVAPIMSDQKWHQFKLKLLSTLTGLPTLGHYPTSPHPTQSTLFIPKLISQILYFLIPSLIIIPSSLITKLSLHPVTVLIPTIISIILSASADIYLQKKKYIFQWNYHKYIATALYCYLWSAHFFIIRHLLHIQSLNSNIFTCIFILSVISVLTSSTTISFSPVRQFSASSFHFEQFQIHSTLYIRFYVVVPLLLTEVISFYTNFYVVLPYISLVVSACFILWTFGWVSSFYNTLMFTINSIFNYLIFGEQLNHSGHNYRGNRIWWVGFVTLSLNCLAIFLNFIFIICSQGKTISEIVQNQHYFLLCSANITSLLVGTIVYCSYRLNPSNHHLVRYGKFNLFQTLSKDKNTTDNKSNQAIYQGKFFFDHKQLLLGLLTLLLPIGICLLTTYFFAELDSGYGTGKNYQYPDSYLPQKLFTVVILGINTLAYLIHLTLKQITRTRSKFGCSINPLCFKIFTVQVERDMFMKYCLKITGALAIAALVLRIQNIDVVVYYMLRITPLEPIPNRQIYLFLYYIGIPILIYRSYKRSQYFSHWFNIVIIISLILTSIDSTYYFYQSVFVVLAIPNFPKTPITLFLISPWTIPKKLVHSHENIYRVGYLLTNILTLFIFYITCGTLEFTMVFGLPLYWCIIPNINSQPFQKQQKISSSTSVLLPNEFQNTNLELLTNQSKYINQHSEHNLYHKIVSEIPFNLFRNKKQGYYLIRINKYLLLAEIINQFYGFFQTINIIGLQSQQVTSCHAKQASTIDRIIQSTWSTNPDTRQCCLFTDTIKTIFHSQAFMKKLKITSDNQMQLTGIISSPQFYPLLKQSLIKSLIYNYQKILKKTDNKFQPEQQQLATKLLYNFYQKSEKQRTELINQFPFEFMEINKWEFSVEKIDSGISISKMRYLQNNSKNNNKQIPIDQYFIQIQCKESEKKSHSNSSSHSLTYNANFTNINNDINNHNNNKTNQKKFQNIPKTTLHPNIPIDTTQRNISIQNSNPQQPFKPNQSQLNMAILLSAYSAILGNQTNHLNQERIYKILKKDLEEIMVFKFQGGLDLIGDSLGAAFKIAIGKQLQGENTVNYADFINYDKNEFLGVAQSSSFITAVQKNKKDIWGVSYNPIKKSLTVKRLAKNTTQLYMFSLDNNAVQAIWNNLRFQLVFVSNDSSQRYSNQTNQNLLVNLLVEGCEEPYGYASYYSQQFLNL